MKPTPQRRTSRAPRSLHDIEFGEEIGSGLFGRVWVARNRINGETLAVKEVSGRTVKSKLNFLKEANVLRNVRHPHLLRLRAVLVQEQTSSDASSLSRSGSRSASSGALSKLLLLRGSGKSAAARTGGANSSSSSSSSSSGALASEQHEEAEEDSTSSEHFHSVAYKCYLVTEYCEAGSLANVLSDRALKIPWRTRIRWAYEAACGLQHLHRSNVIHRDLKRENCLLRRTEERPDAALSHLTLVLADFGLSRYYKSGSKSSAAAAAAAAREAMTGKRAAGNGMTVVGTPWLMAPELMSPKNTAGYTIESEMFTFGVLLLEILTRRRARDIPRVSATLAIDMETVELMAFNPVSADSADSDLTDHVDEVAAIVAERSQTATSDNGGGGDDESRGETGAQASARRRGQGLRRESIAFACPPGLLDVAADCVALDPKRRLHIDEAVERLEALYLSVQHDDDA